MEDLSKPTFMERVHDLLHQGNVHHLVVEKDGRRPVDLPLTIIVLAALLAVWLVAILLAVAVFAGYSVRVENTEQATPSPREPEAGQSDEPGAAEAQDTTPES